MKLARLEYNKKETYGIINGTMVATREDMTYSTGIPIPHNLKDFLFDGWFDEIKQNIDKVKYSKNILEFKILHPIPNPSKVLCLAFNYTDHAKEQNLSPSTEPALVIKPRTALTGTNSDILYPKFVKKLDYEVELALVIGKTIKDVDTQQAKDAIFGYMILNDVSARDIQAQDKQFTRAKGCDTFAPCGPYITTKDEIADPQNLRLTTKVNGQTRQDSNTSKMFIKIPDIVSKISKCMTIEKGDIISTGTPAGVMLNKPNAVFLKDGDRIEMEIEGLGKLVNTVRIRN